jgi:uncharacterized membrane protein
VIAAIVVSVAMAGVAQVLFKGGLNKSGPVREGHMFVTKMILVLFTPRIMAGLALYGFSTLFYLWALSRAPLSFVYPMLALNFVIVTVLSRFVLGEHISGMRATGIAIVIAGVSLVART